MAASTPSTTGGPGTTHLDPPSRSPPSSERPVEMTDLEASKRAADTASHDLNDVSIPTISPLTSLFPPSTGEAEIVRGGAGPLESTGHTISAPETSTDPLSSSGKEPAAVTSDSVATPLSAPLPLTTSDDAIAVGPATDTPVSPVATNEAGPVLVITLLLTSGARHPYKIDEKYLAKRNVNVPGTTESGKKDPFSISVYTLKELILREWREEWEAQPSSPSSIRLIYFGRLLDDKAVLKECRFNAEATNVVHMTVRPQDMIDEEDASKGKALGRDREGTEGTAGCRCVIL